MSENCAAETLDAGCTADRATGCCRESADLALAGAFVVALVGAFVVAPANLGRESVGRLEVAPLLALGLLVAPITMNSVKSTATLLLMMGCLRMRFKGCLACCGLRPRSWRWPLISFIGRTGRSQSNISSSAFGVALSMQH